MTDTMLTVMVCTAVGAWVALGVLVVLEYYSHKWYKQGMADAGDFISDVSTDIDAL